MRDTEDLTAVMVFSAIAAFKLFRDGYWHFRETDTALSRFVLNVMAIVFAFVVSCTVSFVYLIVKIKLST